MDKNSLKNVKRNAQFIMGKDNYLIDSHSKSYIDFCYCLENCLGYSDEGLINLLKKQTERLLNGYIDPLVLDKLALDTSFNKAALTLSANDANYTAYKIIDGFVTENFPNKKTIVTNHKHDSFFLKNIVETEFNNFNDLKSALNEETAALVIQPITEEVNIVDYDYLINAYTLCKALDIALVLDETKIGFNRSGKRFCFQHYGIAPDIVTLSRGLAAGVNMGAVLARGVVGEYFFPYEESLSSLAYKSLEYVLKKIDTNYLNEISDKGEYLLSKLYKLNKHNFVLDIRGKGLIAAIQLSDKISAVKVINQMEKRGFLVGSNQSNIIKLTPPFTISKAEIDYMVDSLIEIFASTNI